MNCPHCGAAQPERGRARLLMSGGIFVVAAILLLLFERMPVTVLAAFLMLVVGLSFFKGASRLKHSACPACGHRP